MKKNKGFTLIEVLAAIIVLGILAAIIIPKLTLTINHSKENTYMVSTEALVDGLEHYVLDFKETLTPFNGCTMDFTNNTTTCINFEFNGKKPDAGELTIDKDGIINGMVTFNNYSLGVTDNIVTDYIPLEYIKSDGNQYIEFDYKPKTNTKVELDLELIENENTMLSSSIGYSNIVGVNKNDDNCFEVNFGGDSNQYKTIFYWVDKDYDGVHAYREEYSNVTNRSKMIIESEIAIFQGVKTSIETKTSDNVSNLILLGRFVSSENKIVSFNRYDAKVYGFKIYEDDKLIMDLIPCKYLKEGGKTGLYDLVNDVFYGSNGEEDFLEE